MDRRLSHRPCGVSGNSLADWKGKGELGASLASGNSENESANAALEVKNTRDKWTHTLGLAGNYGSDYLMRSVTNLAGIWANTQKEVVYFGAVGIDGNQTFTQTWPADSLPASKAKYFWSVIMVDGAEFRVIPNPLNRFLLNKQSGLQFNPDGSLTLAFAPRAPQGVPESNWLPTPQGKRYNLTLRIYGPAKDVADGTYYPPQLQQVRR